MTFEVPSRYLSAFIKMADACRHIDTTAEHVAAMLDSPDVDVVIALWRDPDAPAGIRVWVAKGLPVLEAVIDRGSIATLPMVAFWLRDANMRSPSKHRLLVLRTRDAHCARRARRVRARVGPRRARGKAASGRRMVGRRACRPACSQARAAHRLSRQASVLSAASAIGGLCLRATT
jgi:hypothetical protein